MKKQQIIFCAKCAENANIDAETKIITNVIMAKAGEAQGHGLHVDEDFIKDMVTFANENFENGVPCQFSHSDQVGLQLGKIMNVRYEDGQAIGDLHIYEAADASPVFPGMGKWVVEMAAEDPDAINLSINFSSEHYFQNVDGENIVYKNLYDVEDETIPTFVKFGILHSCDIVHDGAITDTLYQDPKQNKNFLSKAFSFLFSTGEKFDVVKLKNKVLGLTTQLKNKTTELDHLRVVYNQNLTELTGMSAKIKQLKDNEILLKAKVSKLEKSPGIDHTDGDPDPNPGGNKDYNYMDDELNQKAARQFKKKQLPRPKGKK